MSEKYKRFCERCKSLKSGYFFEAFDGSDINNVCLDCVRDIINVYGIKPFEMTPGTLVDNKNIDEILNVETGELLNQPDKYILLHSMKSNEWKLVQKNNIKNTDDDFTKIAYFSNLSKAYKICDYLVKALSNKKDHKTIPCHIYENIINLLNKTIKRGYKHCKGSGVQPCHECIVYECGDNENETNKKIYRLLKDIGELSPDFNMRK